MVRSNNKFVIVLSMFINKMYGVTNHFRSTETLKLEAQVVKHSLGINLASWWSELPILDSKITSCTFSDMPKNSHKKSSIIPLMSCPSQNFTYLYQKCR